MFSFKVDDQQEEAALSHTTSVQSFAETQPESTIIRQTALNSTVFSAGIQSPDSVDDRCLLIQWIGFRAYKLHEGTFVHAPDICSDARPCLER